LRDCGCRTLQKKRTADKAAAEKAAAVAAALAKGAMEKAAMEKAAILARAPISNTIGMKLKEIRAGTFTMGSPGNEVGRQDDEHQHKVTISKSFYMQTTEVTQEQWRAVMATEPWKGRNHVKEGPNYAASYVSWDDAVAYCKKLSEKESKTYRLPTEAEWEYACRAGTESIWNFGDDEKIFGDYAWYDKNAGDIGEKYAHQVRQKKANAFGLYDMHGNVYEWCHDYFEEDYYKQSPAQDPTGPVTGSFRVFRGGSWGGNTRYTRSAHRHGLDADYRGSNDGFRLVRELD
jgi:formylglycine-generating enzyme required for sulfatase activity